ncbi:peptide ligase PGM1-related protein [Streptomyces sp. NPDC015346]|uniref:preATP grasp domain-containing protein n=1 Tax=Streptomyces sp. NPDC015346 TaxID=3364954 RepID=UPI003702937B
MVPTDEGDVRRLWVANCNSEYMVDRLDELDPKEREGTPVVGARMVWLLRDGDVLVLPQPVDPSFVSQVGALMGFDPARVTLLTPEDDSVRVLSQDVLHRADILGPLRALVQVPGDWEVRAYLSDRGIAALARAIGLPEGAVSAFDSAGGAELFNSKAGFRALAAGLSVPVPDGAVCATRGDLERVLDRLTAPTGAVIVKADRNSGGTGNLLCLADPRIPALGASRTLPLTGEGALEAIVSHTRLEATHAPHGQVIAETYHPHCRSLCLEVLCPAPEDGPPHVLNIGEMLMEPVWNGFIMPAPDTLAENVHDTLVENALRLAAGMRDFGYRGLVNIDAIVAPDGHVWFNEVNARLGGCTHLHHLAAVLLGPHWQRDHVLATHNDLPTRSLPQLLKKLDEHRLAFTASTGQGVVITADDSRRSGTVEYAVLATDLDTARTMESRLRALAT